jgi:exopolysaccharide biosynthesis predicted pyruvyltransferase EpsI
MNTSTVEDLEASRQKLLQAIGESDDVTFVRIHGNLGDELIYAGTRQLLAGIHYRELSMRSFADATGHTALISGGGSWCNAYQAMPDYLPQVEKRFQRVIVLPSSFDVSVDRVKAALRGTKAMIFARERESFRQIRDLCIADLAHDCALFFDYRPYRRQGRGVLNAFRTDREGLPFALPLDNNDLSVTCGSLDEWLWTIARCEMVQTDRAHVTIAAAMLGKKVRYRPSNYHKVPAIIEFSLQGFPVEAMSQVEMEKARLGEVEACMSPATRAGDLAWVQAVRRAAQEMVRIVPPGCSFILVDDDRLGSLPISDRRAIPFLERGGQYWGAPPDDDEAIDELKRLREAGPNAMVFAWPAFWWLDHYKRLSEYLTRRFPCVLRNELLIVFDLSAPFDESRSG